jgi:hypothetical protein
MRGSLPKTHNSVNYLLRYVRLCGKHWEVRGLGADGDDVRIELAPHSPILNVAVEKWTGRHTSTPFGLTSLTHRGKAVVTKDGLVSYSARENVEFDPLYWLELLIRDAEYMSPREVRKEGEFYMVGNTAISTEPGQSFGNVPVADLLAVLDYIVRRQ